METVCSSESDFKTTQYDSPEDHNLNMKILKDGSTGFELVAVQRQPDVSEEHVTPSMFLRNYGLSPKLHYHPEYYTLSSYLCENLKSKMKIL
jgi:hypothetical protein